MAVGYCCNCTYANCYLQGLHNLEDQEQTYFHEYYSLQQVQQHRIMKIPVLALPSISVSVLWKY